MPVGIHDHRVPYSRLSVIDIVSGLKYMDLGPDSGTTNQTSLDRFEHFPTNGHLPVLLFFPSSHKPPST